MPRPPKDLRIEGFEPPALHSRAPIRVAPGDAVVPHKFTVGIRLGEPHYLMVRLSIEMVEGGEARVVELAVVPTLGVNSPVTTAMLRSIPIEALTKAAVTFMKRDIAAARPDLWPGAFQLEGDSDDIVPTVAAPPANAAATRAAGIYARAVAGRSRAPTEVVALEMSVSRSQASRYVRAARDSGLLPPARPQTQRPYPTTKTKGSRS